MNKTALTRTPGTTRTHPALLPLASSGQSTPTTIGTGSLLTATTTTTTAVGATAAAGSNDANTNSTTANTNSAANLPPTVPYRSAGGLASESPAAVLSAMNHPSSNNGGGFHNANATGNTGGGASVSTISPGSLAGNGNGNGHPTTGHTSNQGGGGGGACVEFTARDATALRPPDLGMGMGIGIGTTTPNPSSARGTNSSNDHVNTAAARPNLSVDAAEQQPAGGSGNGSIAPPSSSTSATTSPTSRPSPRSAALRTNLNASRTTLHASLHSYSQTQNTHLESAFGALMQSIQEHTEELDVHQDNLDR